ncbi:NME NM23 family member 5 [Nesidiocoris tenuis]|uniref:NME NM23 family member 5 n=1 Tax=Nesidiocoris tenuis TaxID=355587 RepID=A0ABN7AUG8_9HEMI|nr:NME NM23 family member 5 [Nesidiocoris tenuis]
MPRRFNIKGLDEMICPPKVYFHYEVQQDASTDDDFDWEPVDFHHKGLQNLIGYQPEPFGARKQEEHTLCMIKPSAYENASEIIQSILAEGFTILKRKALLLFPEQAAAFYTRHYGRTWFPKAVLRLSSGPVIVMVLAKENAVEDLKVLCGPERVKNARKEQPFSLRATYGKRGDPSMNAIHASDSVADAKREIFYFFKHANPEPQISAQDKLSFFLESNYTALLDGLTELCRQRPINPALWFYKFLSVNKNAEPPLITYPQEWPPTKEKTFLDPTMPEECQ